MPRSLASSKLSWTSSSNYSFVAKFDEKNISVNASVTAKAQTPADADLNHDAFGVLDQQLDLGDEAASMSTPFQGHMPSVIRSDEDGSHLPQRPAPSTLSSRCAISSDDQLGEHMIESGTISISTAYSHGLLTPLPQALQSSGLDLSQANISIRIDLGKRPKQSLV